MPILAEFDCKANMSIDLLQMEHIYLGKEWNYSLCDNFTRIYFILDGEGIIYSENETIRLQPGNIYIIPAMYPFRCKCSGHLEKVFSHVKCSILPNKDLLSNINRVITYFDCAEQVQKVKSLLHQKGIYSQLRVQIILESIVLSLIQPLEEAFAYDYSLYRKFENFFSYTSSHIHAGLSIDEICNNIGMTPRQLSYQYKSATGQSVKSYLNTLLIERIKYYLITTDRSLQSISEELQFSNEFYCSRFFKKGTGLSPREYRHQLTDYRKNTIQSEPEEI